MIAKLAFKLIKQFTDISTKNVIDDDKPKLYACNHTSLLDGIVLSMCLKNPLFVVHKEVVKNPVYAKLLKVVDHVVISSDHPFALRRVFRQFQDGRVKGKKVKSVVIFPEGRLSLTGSLMKVYPGAVYVAFKAGVPIIPLHIDGLASSIYSKVKGDNPKKKYPKITVTAGSRIDPIPDFNKKRDLAKGTMILKKAMTDLVFNALNEPKSLDVALYSSIQKHRKKQVIIEDIKGPNVSYQTFWQMATGMAHILEKFVPNETNSPLGVLLPNLPVTAALLFGASIADKILAMLNYSMGKDPFISCLKTANIKTIITSKQFIEKGKLHRFIEYASSVDVEFIYLEDLKTKIGLKDKLAILARSKFPEFGLKQNNNVILFTSGSEGLPKGVVLSHEALLSNVAQIRSVVDISMTDKVFNAMPMFHSFGLTAGTLLPILNGTKVILYPTPLDYREIPDLVYDKDCTVLFGTNTFLSKYAKFANPEDFVRLRYVVAGAEKVLPATREVWFEKFGIRIFEGYGATECAPVICVNTPVANKFGTVGKVLPFIEYMLDRQGLEHLPESQGKFLVKGPNLYSGYLLPNNPGNLKVHNGDDYYDTGDIVDIDGDGFVKIVGRTKRAPKIAGGEMVALDAVENAVLKSVDNEQVSCAAVDIPTSTGDQIMLFITSTDFTKSSFGTYLRSNGLSSLWNPRFIEYVQEIPLLGSGKTDYAQLKQVACEIYETKYKGQ